jgi:hypothetical protein
VVGNRDMGNEITDIGTELRLCSIKKQNADRFRSALLVV